MGSYTKLLTFHDQNTYTLTTAISNFKWIGVYGSDYLNDNIGNMYGFRIIPVSIFKNLCNTNETAFRYEDVVLGYIRYVDDTHIYTSNVSINSSPVGYLHIAGIK